jgi:hypothetical protein
MAAAEGMNRRNILTVLGVAAVGTPALASELIDTKVSDDALPQIPGLALPSEETQKRFAEALEHAAAAVRSGEMTCLAMGIDSQVKLNEWMQHKVTFTFELGLKPVVA